MEDNYNYKEFLYLGIMNPHIDDKLPLAPGEFSELRELISNGTRNFSSEVLATAEFLHPLNLKRSSIPTTHIATAKFLFKCHTCSEIGFPIQWYQIILTSVGGTALYQPRSRVSDLEKGYNGENLAKIKDDDKMDYQESSINFIKSVGYVCDHCRESIFEN